MLIRRLDEINEKIMSETNKIKQTKMKQANEQRRLI